MKWLDDVIESHRDASRTIETLIAAANTVDRAEIFYFNFLNEEPVENLIDRLNSGTGDAADQWRASRLISKAYSDQPRKPGTKPRPNFDRDLVLVLAATETTLIKKIFKEYYGAVHHNEAVEIACRRIFDRLDAGEIVDVGVHKDREITKLIEQVHQTLRKSGAANFSVLP